MVSPPGELPPGTQTVVLVARTRSKAGGWTETGRTSIGGCSVQPATGSRDLDARAQSRAQVRIFGPPELAKARITDAVEVEGWQVGSDAAAVALQVLAPGTVLADETGRAHHCELDTMWIEG